MAIVGRGCETGVIEPIVDETVWPVTVNEGKTDPAWRGVHHLAMVTPDMDATVRFYVGVLSMPLVATLRAGPIRHYFFALGPGNTIAFFEVPGAETFSKRAGTPISRPFSSTTFRSPSPTKRP